MDMNGVEEIAADLQNEPKPILNATSLVDAQNEDEMEVNTHTGDPGPNSANKVDSFLDMDEYGHKDSLLDPADHENPFWEDKERIPECFDPEVDHRSPPLSQIQRSVQKQKQKLINFSFY